MFQGSWKIKIRRGVVTVFAAGLFLLPAPIASAQKATSFDIAQWRDMLRNVKRELVKHDYDPNFHGMDPDELMLPTPEDMASERDPVLAHAASLVGVKLDPITAGKLFPMEWKRM